MYEDKKPSSKVKRGEAEGRPSETSWFFLNWLKSIQGATLKTLTQLKKKIFKTLRSLDRPSDLPIQFLLIKTWILVLDSKQKGNNNGWQKGGSEILKIRIRRPDCFFLTWPIENRIFWSSIYVLNVWTLHSTCAEFEATTFAGNWKIRN